MKFYHYLALSDYHSMGADGVIPPGLVPDRRLISLSYSKNGTLPEKAYEHVARGFLDKGLPLVWCQKSTDMQMPLLESEIRYIASYADNPLICLLEVQCLPTDKVFVANYSHHVTRAYRDIDRSEKTAVAIKQAYWNSLIPLADYLKGSVDYFLPQVICFSFIPMERLSPVDVQRKHHLINCIRTKGGFETIPLRPEPNYSLIDELLDRKLVVEGEGQSDLKRSGPKRSGKYGHLTLV
jgi:hypothetical protein